MAVWKPARYQHTRAERREEGKRGNTRYCLRRCLRAFSLTFPQDSESTNTSSIPLEPRPRLTRPSHPFVYQITYSDHPRPASRPDAITSPSHHTCADTRRATLENPHNQKIQAALPPSPAKIDTLQSTASTCAASTHTAKDSHHTHTLAARSTSASPANDLQHLTLSNLPSHRKPRIPIPPPPIAIQTTSMPTPTGVQVIHT